MRANALLPWAFPLRPLSRKRERDRTATRFDPIAQQWEGEGRHRHPAIPHPSHPFGMGPFPLPRAGEGNLKARPSSDIRVAVRLGCGARMSDGAGVGRADVLGIAPERTGLEVVPARLPALAALGK